MCILFLLSECTAGSLGSSGSRVGDVCCPLGGFRGSLWCFFQPSQMSQSLREAPGHTSEPAQYSNASLPERSEERHQYSGVVGQGCSSFWPWMGKAQHWLPSLPLFTGPTHSSLMVFPDPAWLEFKTEILPLVVSRALLRGIFGFTQFLSCSCPVRKCVPW